MACEVVEISFVLSNPVVTVSFYQSDPVIEVDMVTELCEEEVGFDYTLDFDFA